MPKLVVFSKTLQVFSVAETAKTIKGSGKSKKTGFHDALFD